MKKSIFFFASALLVLATAGCRKHSIDQPVAADPKTEKIDFPVSANDDLASLGRVLFYDKNLSHNNSVSCASCHQQSKAFCDQQQFSTGLEGHKTPRNSPSIFARQGRMFWDARARSMTDLSLMPVKNHVEMKMPDLRALCQKLSGMEYYRSLFEQAFGTADIDSNRIQLAMGEFLRNFDFSDNKFRRSRLNLARLNASEELGRELFFGKAGCINCHTIIDERVPDRGYGRTDLSETFNIGLDEVYNDRGVGEVTGSASDYGMFLLPVLLNVEHTAPYMHDGRFRTLEEVVEHYNSGVKNHPNLSMHLRDLSKYPDTHRDQVFIMLDKNRDNMLDASESESVPPKRLNLSHDEKRCLVAFLKTLTDDRIFTDKRFSDPFAAK